MSVLRGQRTASRTPLPPPAAGPPPPPTPKTPPAAEQIEVTQPGEVGRRYVDGRADEVARLRTHSEWLNEVGWTLAAALGDIPAGATVFDAEPLDLARRAAAEIGRLRRQLDAAVCAARVAVGERDVALARLSEVQPPRPTPRGVSREIMNATDGRS